MRFISFTDCLYPSYSSRVMAVNYKMYAHATGHAVNRILAKGKGGGGPV